MFVITYGGILPLQAIFSETERERERERERDEDRGRQRKGEGDSERERERQTDRKLMEHIDCIIIYYAILPVNC